MILEVNNTFDERWMYFLEAEEEVDSSPQPSPRQTVFRQSWPKDFHVSPFNSRKGSYTLRATDPLSPLMQGTGPISVTINLVSSAGHRKLVAHLAPAGAAIDPCTMTSLEKLRFLTSWWWVGLVTFPRILAQAARLYFHHNLLVWHTPEPKRRTISRRASPAERQLEPLFARYLRHLVEQSTCPIRMNYYSASAAASNSPPQVFLSPAARDLAQAQAQAQQQNNPPSPRIAVEDVVDLHVLTPAFYARFVQYADTREALACEGLEGGGIWVSSGPADLLARLASGATEPPTPVVGGSGLWKGGWFGVIVRLRERCSSSFSSPSRMSMDAYVLGHESAKEKAVYRNCVLRVLLARRIALGSVALLEGQLMLAQACFAWVVSSVVSSVMAG